MASLNGINGHTYTNGDTHNKTVGIIGMGEMGKMYARKIGAAGWR